MSLISSLISIFSQNVLKSAATRSRLHGLCTPGMGVNLSACACSHADRWELETQWSAKNLRLIMLQPRIQPIHGRSLNMLQYELYQCLEIQQ